MKKATIKRLLAVVVGVLIIAASLTAGFGASAAAPADVDAPYYGTEADGFDSAGSSYPMNLKPTDDIYNLDFQFGFRFWSGKKYNSASDPGSLASDSFELVTEGTNKYIKVKAEGYVNNIRSALFTAKNVKVGDKLVVIYDAKGADFDSIKVQVKQDHLKTDLIYDETTGMNITDPTNANKRQNASPGVAGNMTGTATDPEEFPVQTKEAGWKTYMLPTNIPVEDPTNKATAGCQETIYLQVLVSKGSDDIKAGDKLDAAIDNIRIAKVENGVYTDVATNEVIYPEPKYPAYYGTADKGFDSNLAHYPLYLKPLDGISNLDFSDGFCCWAGIALPIDQGAGSYASDAFDLVTEGDNKYAKIKADGYVSNMCTTLFKVSNVEAGDNLVVIYDAKGEDVANLRVKLVQEFLKEKAVYDEKTGLNTTLKADGVTLLNPSPGVPAAMVGTSVENAEFDVQTEAAGWKTYIAETNQSVFDPKSSQAQAATGDTLRDDIYLQIVVTCPSDTGIVAGDKVDAAIDNIRIAKVVDGKYINIADNSVIFDSNAAGGGNDDSGNGGAGTGGSGNGGSSATGDSVLALAALFFISGAAVFGTAKAMKNR